MRDSREESRNSIVQPAALFIVYRGFWQTPLAAGFGSDSHVTCPIPGPTTPLTLPLVPKLMDSFGASIRRMSSQVS